MSNNPFTPWWYYEMGKDAAKHSNQKIGNGAFALLAVCLILGLVLFGISVACIWCIIA